MFSNISVTVICNMNPIEMLVKNQILPQTQFFGD